MNSRLRFGLIFSAACVGGVYAHEIGHAVAGWVQGIAVFPTPAKEYALQPPVEWAQEIWISFGGVAATMLITLAALLWYLVKPARRPWSDAVLAGVLLPAGLYTLRFLIVGRGHDAVEWQAAQTAMGVNPAGHVVDILFLCLSVGAAAAVAVRRRATLRLASILKAAGLAFAGIVLLIVLQVVNNAVFDGFFPTSTTTHVPAGLGAK